MIVPGRGRLSDEYDVSEYRDMISIIRDRIQKMAAAGASLDQVKAARPTTDYDTRYGATSGRLDHGYVRGGSVRYAAAEDRREVGLSARRFSTV